MTPSTTILRDCASAFKEVRQNLIEGAALLYKIREEKLYEGKYSSFGAYCEEECQISQSFAAKVCHVYGHYVLEGGLQPKQIGQVDAEKLYLALRLPGDAEAQFTRASTWSRSDIKAELASKGVEECIHPSYVEICTVCHARIS